MCSNNSHSTRFFFFEANYFGKSFVSSHEELPFFARFDGARGGQSRSLCLRPIHSPSRSLRVVVGGSKERKSHGLGNYRIILPVPAKPLSAKPLAFIHSWMCQEVEPEQANRQKTSIRKKCFFHSPTRENNVPFVLCFLFRLPGVPLPTPHAHSSLHIFFTTLNMGIADLAVHVLEAVRESCHEEEANPWISLGECTAALGRRHRRSKNLSQITFTRGLEVFLKFQVHATDIDGYWCFLLMRSCLCTFP